MIKSLIKNKTSWIILISILLFIIWFNLPNYVACSNFEKLGAYEENKLCIFPDDVIVEGDIDGLPKALHVKGNLKIQGTFISNLPSKLHVDGDLYLYKTSIGSIPEDTYIGGYFHNDLGFGSPNVYCDELPLKVVIKGSNGCQL